MAIACLSPALAGNSLEGGMEWLLTHLRHSPKLQWVLHGRE